MAENFKERLCSKWWKCPKIKTEQFTNTKLNEVKLCQMAKLRNVINKNRDIGAASLLGRLANGETGRRSSTRWASGKNQE